MNSLKNNNSVLITVKMNFSYNIRRKCQKILCKVFGFDLMTKIYYFLEMKHRLNLNNPQLFSEKICWYKLRYCCRSEKIINCSDKYLVRDYLTQKGFADFLPEELFVYDFPEEIIWSELPQKFALKCSHGCAYNIIVFDKNNVDEYKVKQLMKKWQKDAFGYYNAEPHYKDSHKTSKILCEAFIETSDLLPTDYKVHCINGEPKFVLTCTERTAEYTKLLFYDLNRKPLNYGTEIARNSLNIDDSIWEGMVSISKKIAEDFPFVRVDFYIYKGKLIIGELTFSPAAGYITYLNSEGDRQIGKLFDISNLLG